MPSSTTLKPDPCALCGYPAQLTLTAVRCRRCGCRGPVSPTRGEKVSSWNAMQSYIAAGKPKPASKPRKGGRKKVGDGSEEEGS